MNLMKAHINIRSIIRTDVPGLTSRIRSIHSSRTSGFSISLSEGQ